MFFFMAIKNRYMDALWMLFKMIYNKLHYKYKNKQFLKSRNIHNKAVVFSFLFIWGWGVVEVCIPPNILIESWCGYSYVLTLKQKTWKSIMGIWFYGCNLALFHQRALVCYYYYFLGVKKLPYEYYTD